MTKLISRAGVAVLITGIAFLFNAQNTLGQQAEPEVVRIETVDGLNLWGKWFQGGKGNKSDTVIMVHAYGKECSKGSQWEDLAKSLQKEDFSVIMFDLRGHGESAKTQALQDWKKFCEERYNKLSGYILNPNANTQEIKKDKPFQPAYYPYLINDLAAVRRFVDKKNDANNCNSGRIFIIAEGSICPLVMMSVSTEFLRNGVYPAVVGANAPEHPAGKDIAGLVFLSWANSIGPGHNAAINLMNTAWKKPEIWQENKANPTFVAERMKENVAMTFVYSKDDKASEAEMRRWYNNRFGMKGKEDKLLRKYSFEMAAAKLAGINLMDVLVDEKVKKTVNGKEVEETVKVPAVQQYIIGFIKATVENGKNGGIHTTRNINTYKPESVPLWRLGLPLP